MVSHPELGSDPPIGSDQESGCDSVHPISSFFTYNQLSSRSYSFIASLDFISLSNTFQEALSHLDWRSAMIEDMDTLNGNGTWKLVHLPTRKKAIGCRWVFIVNS